MRAAWQKKGGSKGPNRGVRGVEETVEEFADPAATLELDFDVGCELPGALPHLALPRLDEFAIPARGDLESVMHAQVISKEEDIDEWSDCSELGLQVAQMALKNPLEETVGANRFGGEDPFARGHAQR